MEMTNTKRKILEVSLELFSTYGYEATSVNQIATALGIKKPSLYSHFKSKQEIFDVLINEITERYEEHSFFVNTNWDDPAEDHTKFTEMTPEDAAEIVLKQVQFLIHDPGVSKVRKMLTIEQFQNPQLAAMQEKRAYRDIMNYHVGLIKYLIREGILTDGDPEIMALQYMAPISMEMYRVDRNPEAEEEAMQNIRKHIIKFGSIYREKE